MKNIIIIGPPRTGKTTLAKMILRAFPAYNYLSGDAIQSSNIIIKDGDKKLKTNKTIQINFVEKLGINIFDLSTEFEPDLRFILDSSFVDFEDILEFDSEKYVALVFGIPDITLEEGLINLRENDNENDWTKYESSYHKELIVKRAIEDSKELQKKCKKYNIKFINTSYNRGQAINEAFTWLKNHI